MKAVRFDHYGGVDVLDVREVEDPVAGPGRVLVAVKAAGINPGEIPIREGVFQERWPATFPSGEGTISPGSCRPSARAWPRSPPVTKCWVGPRSARATPSSSRFPPIS